jgi:hypothetical protein
MSLFISQENQTLLYEMINKTPEINSVFSSIEEKNQWFRGIIAEYYQKMPQTITRETLLATNRQVLGYMVGSIRTLASKKSTSNNPVIPMNTLKRDNPPNLDQVQNQYRSMFEVPKPKQIDFSEKIEDEVITNMDELIEQQKRMRERELQEYSPMPPTVTTGSPKVAILEDLPKDVLQATNPTIIGERRVRFNEPSNDGILEKRMDRIEEKLDDFISLFREHILSKPLIQNDFQKEVPNNLPNDTVIKENITMLKQMIHSDENIE